LARTLIVAYTTYFHDARVRHHAEALANRDDEVNVLSIAAGEPRRLDRVVIGRQAGASPLPEAVLDSNRPRRLELGSDSSAMARNAGKP
jgi:hypothetical protein